MFYSLRLLMWKETSWLAMLRDIKSVDSLRIDDLRRHPVWQYTNRAGRDETYVRPAIRVPADSLDNQVVGTQVVLANGSSVWALIGNVESKNARLTEHFLKLSVEREGRWFVLARYHDSNYAVHGPEVLAEFLGLPIDQVFPIAYDIRPYVQGDVAALAGQIRKEPRERLSRSELIAMAVP